jgi:hypothetical protein
MSDGALDTDEGAALATEIVEMLESELVRFQHRVEHDHGIELDRARAAMVLLGKLVAAGVRWTAKPDSDPSRIQEAFASLMKKHPAIATTLKREIAGFFVATTDVQVAEDTTRTPAAILRRAGADPSLWWWAGAYSEPAKCWAACGDPEKLVQVALAFGVPVTRVARALATVFGVVATRIKTRYATHRTTLVAELAKVAATGRLDDPSTITKLAFELRWKDQQASDPASELAIHAFQLVEALQAAKAKPDVERFGVLTGRAERMFSSRGLQLAAMLRKELDDSATDAIAKL